MGQRSQAGHRNYGSFTALAPYFNASGLRSLVAVPCDSLGTTYLVPASVYLWRAASEQSKDDRDRFVKGEGVAIRHYAHVLTEHFPVVHAAKYLLRMAVVLVPSLRVFHADLPRFGEGFHGNSFDR